MRRTRGEVCTPAPMSRRWQGEAAAQGRALMWLQARSGGATRFLRPRWSGVRDGELYFGAMNACDCAASMSLEDIAAHHYRAAQFLAPSIESPIPPGDTPLNRALHYLAEESDASEPVMGRDRQAHALDGMRLLTGFVDALLGERRNGPAHARLKAAWGLNDRSAESGASGARSSQRSRAQSVDLRRAGLRLHRSLLARVPACGSRDALRTPSWWRVSESL